MVLSWFRSSAASNAPSETESSPSTPASQPTEPQSQPQPQTQTQTPPTKPANDSDLPKLWTPQTNTKLFVGGALFFAFSLLTTRRAMVRRFNASIPPYYTSSIYHKPDVNGGLEAFEALHLATINVLSFGMMTSGGVLWAMGINGLDDLRAYVKKGMTRGDPAEGSKTDADMEKEVEAWVMRYLGKKIEDGKLKDLDKGSSQEGKST
ncbi:hypothetical protein BDV18DRAFT_141375 [Aspergillus unguis]